MFKGAATPVMTPLNAQQEIDYNATEKVIEFLIGHKMDALLFTGSCGEFLPFPTRRSGTTSVSSVTVSGTGTGTHWYRRN